MVKVLNALRAQKIDDVVKITTPVGRRLLLQLEKGKPILVERAPSTKKKLAADATEWTISLGVDRVCSISKGRGTDFGIQGEDKCPCCRVQVADLGSSNLLIVVPICGISRS